MYFDIREKGGIKWVYAWVTIFNLSNTRSLQKGHLLFLCLMYFYLAFYLVSGIPVSGPICLKGKSLIAKAIATTVFK